MGMEVGAMNCRNCAFCEPQGPASSAGECREWYCDLWEKWQYGTNAGCEHWIEGDEPPARDYTGKLLDRYEHRADEDITIHPTRRGENHAGYIAKV